MPMTPVSRPRFLNLLQIRFPVPAVISIMHRASGAALLHSIPLMLWLLDRSLESKSGFDEVLSLLGSPGGRVLLFLLLWALSHHLLAGIRYLLIDVEVGVEKSAARRSAWLVAFGAPLLALLLTGALT